MNIFSGALHSKMSRMRGRSPGWAAFDIKQRQKRGVEPEFDVDPYPPMPNITSFGPTKNSVKRNLPSEKTFSSVLQPSMDFPIFTDSSKSEILVGNSSRVIKNQIYEKINTIPILEKLKKQHSWADDCLIADILASVNNDEDQASALLKAMVSSSSDGMEADHLEPNFVPKGHLPESSKSEVLVGSSSRMITNQISERINTIPILEKLKKQHSWADDCLIKDILATVNNDEDQASAHLKAMVSSSCDGMEADLLEPSFVPESRLPEKKNECLDEDSMLGNQLSNNMHRNLILGNLYSIPVEPEWEEDDVYLSHRKDAIRKMRSASQHSRAASNAFLRGDHFSAQHLSLKARGEWLDAEKLNAKAAEEILHVRNNKNDVWKLDLHGLHASEAVRALKAHLHRIESRTLMSPPGSLEVIMKPEAVILSSPSVESTNCLDMEANADKQQAVSRQRDTVLQVITGTGNHSRGQAALPTAVRSFLIENRYRFDDDRPGVFAVRPKFRRM